MVEGADKGCGTVRDPDVAGSERLQSHIAKVALILGAGPNLGHSIAKPFSEDGYTVALAARSIGHGLSDDGFLGIQGDSSDPKAVRAAFETTTQELGHPSVVVYNVAHRFLTPSDDPLSASLDGLEASRKAGFDSTFVAAQEAFRGFRSLPSTTPTAFIYTGNTLNQNAISGVLPFALAKTAAAMLIEYAANAYGKDGHRFYYADQRQPDGRPANVGRDEPAHAEMYLQLVREPT